MKFTLPFRKPKPATQQRCDKCGHFHSAKDDTTHRLVAELSAQGKYVPARLAAAVRKGEGR